MAKIKKSTDNHLATKLICIFVISLAGILLYVGLQIYTDSMYQYYSRSFKRGQIAESDLLVNNAVDVYDEITTNNLKEQNAKAILPIFVYSRNDTLDSIEKFDTFKSASSSEILSISYEVLTNILNRGYFRYSDLSKASSDGYSEICVIRDSKEETVDLSSPIISDYNFQSTVNNLLAKYNLSMSEVSEVSKIVLNVINSNVLYDDLLTTERRAEAAENTEPVYISFEKGQVLLEKDRVITDEQLHLIRVLGGNSSITLADILGEAAFIFISMIFAFFLFSFVLGNDKFHSVQYLWILMGSLVVTCVVAFFSINVAINRGIRFVETFIPVCFVPVLITMITGRRSMGFYASLIVGILSSAIPGSTYLTFFYCTLSGVLCCFVVRLTNKRTDMFVQWLISLAISSALAVLYIFIGAYSNIEIVPVLIGNAINITGTHVLIAIILPLLERVFNLPTVFRLNELAYGNNPLLSKLADAAPGTYSHSKMVSELSEAASKAIGANAVLARVGGLYHDIGKTEHPEYFVENQSGVNKLDDLNPSLSVSVIKSHVKVGADMAREAGLPGELIDIIANHHGNDIIAYFYNEAKKLADDDDTVSTADYSYSNTSIPETKECAIVMLADSVEAAARTVSDPTAAKFTKLINTIVFGKIERGQLDNCDLSMKEIDVLKESFLKTLSAQYHNRIEYPDGEDDK